jgi:hypothetical protein
MAVLAQQRRMGVVMPARRGSEPQITYIDLTDATYDAIGMTGRFMRGRPRDVIALWLTVWACFVLLWISLDHREREMFTQRITSTDFSILSLAHFAYPLVVLLISIGPVTGSSLLIARATFARDNLYWKCRGGSHRIIGQLGVSLRQLWRDVHEFRDTLERQVGRKPSRLRWLARNLNLLAGLIAVSPIFLFLFKDLEGPLKTKTAGFLFGSMGVAFVLFLISRRLRMPAASDWSYRSRAWITRLTGLSIIVGWFGVSYAGMYLLVALIDSGLLPPSSQASTILWAMYVLLDTTLLFGWLFATIRVVVTFINYLQRAKKISLAQASDRERRDPRAPITVLRSFADEATKGKLSYSQLEATIEEAASVYGPVVAAGAPGQLPPGEIGRKYFTPDTWKDGVINYLDRSLLLLLIPATSAGVQWEIDTIVSRGHVGKLFLALMPTRDLAVRQRVLIEGFQGTHWERPIADADFSEALAAYFEPDGGLVVLTSSNREGSDYQLAIHCAVHAMFCRRPAA